MLPQEFATTETISFEILNELIIQNNFSTIRTIVESTKNYNTYILVGACICGKIEIVKLLLENGVDIHYTDDNALRVACEVGHYDIVKLLLDAGANIHAKYGDPLMIVCEFGHYDIAKLLLENGANVNALDGIPLAFACYFGHYNIAKLLLESGANVNSFGDALMEYCAPVEIDKVAAQLETIKLAVSHGADIPDEILVNCCMYDEYYDIVKFLLDSGANINAIDEEIKLKLVKQKCYKIIPLLKEYGLEFDAENLN